MTWRNPIPFDSCEIGGDVVPKASRHPIFAPLPDLPEPLMIALLNSSIPMSHMRKAADLMLQAYKLGRTDEHSEMAENHLEGIG